MRTPSISLLLSALVATTAVAAPDSSVANAEATSSLYIVQAKSVDAASRRVRSAGIEAERELAVINAVTAYLTPAQLVSLRNDASVRVYEDRSLETRSLFGALRAVTNSAYATLGTNPVVQVVQQTTAPVTSTVLTLPVTSSVTGALVKGLSSRTGLQDGASVASLPLLYETNYPALIGADTLQAAGIKGKGVTIAVLDTGLWQDVSQNYGTRVLASIDVTNGGSGPVKERSIRPRHARHVDRRQRLSESRRWLSRHRPQCEPGRRARVQR